MGRLERNRIPRNIGGEKYRRIESISVFSFSPEPADRNGPLTEVHMHIVCAGELPMVMRMKSAESVDGLIEMLREHRTHVFGPPG